MLAPQRYFVIANEACLIPLLRCACTCRSRVGLVLKLHAWGRYFVESRGESYSSYLDAREEWLKVYPSKHL